jgi:2-keto-4-pentenoate hydratase
LTLRVGVECEIAVELCAEIAARPDGKPHTRETVLSAVRRACAAIEIVDDRYVDYVNRVPGWPVW